MKKKIAVYPGSFDPLTYGHMDVIQRSLKIFDRVVVSIFINSNKKSLFSVEERCDILKKVLLQSAINRKSIEIDCFDGLLVDYLKEKKTDIVIRGLRAISDLEYEFQYAASNRTLYPDIETIFFMPRQRYSYLSSSVVREIAYFNGDVSKMVPPYVVKKIKEKFKQLKG
ncbi:MAG: pantetheine-phosphate adenylyltransferase [Elusimicrobia bacterium]|nr:pantetheine-phosphate adenylyltransferase [Elusimicrobiota bacterium]